MIQRPVNQLDLFLDDEHLTGNSKLVTADTTTTFVDNMSIPIHRWFRYTAGFSAQWVRGLIEREKPNGRHRVLDPFAGSGTVLLEGERCDVEAMGIEAHPFVARVANAKLHWRESPKEFRQYAFSVLDKARTLESSASDSPRLLQKCFPQESLLRLYSLREALLVCDDSSPLSELTWLALASIIRVCSPVGTAQWQYILPNKTKAFVVDPYEAFETRVYLMSNDMAARQGQSYGQKAILLQDDARKSAVPNAWADLVITSPPYANNYDYADATRLEMTFFGMIDGWGDLQESVRKYLVRSCTQHVASMNGSIRTLMDDSVLHPIQEELSQVYNKLDTEKELHGGKKPYHTMILAYFHDLANAWIELRRITRSGALVCFVIGDSAPYGVYVPVDRWLGELAIAAGFKHFSFEKTRDRNVKWKNRKHRVPLHEGRLWVDG